jgi:hypothetical protein
MGKHRAPGTPSPAHPWLRKATAVSSITILIATALGGGAVYAVNGLGKNIISVDTSDLNENERPATVTQTDTSATNILILGSDSRAGSNGSYGNVDGARSDTTLLVHVYEGREAATVVSIPRDSFVEIAGCKMLQFLVRLLKFINGATICAWPFSATIPRIDSIVTGGMEDDNVELEGNLSSNEESNASRISFSLRAF